MFRRHATHEAPRGDSSESSLASVALFLLTGCEDAPVLADVVRRREDAESFGGTWVTTAMTSRESCTMSVALEQTGRLVRGSVHLGPPAFDVTLLFAGSVDRHGRLAARMGAADGLVSFAGQLYDDGTVLAGPVSYAGRVLFTLELQRR